VTDVGNCPLFPCVLRRVKWHTDSRLIWLYECKTSRSK